MVNQINFYSGLGCSRMKALIHYIQFFKNGMPNEMAVTSDRKSNRQQKWPFAFGIEFSVFYIFFRFMNRKLSQVVLQ